MKEGTFVKIIGGNKRYRGRFGQVSRNLSHGKANFPVYVAQLVREGIVYEIVRWNDDQFQVSCFGEGRDDELKVIHVPEGAL